MPLKPKVKMSLTRAIVWVLLSIVFISGPIAGGWFYYLHMQKKRLQDSAYNITAIIQKRPEKDALPSSYLAELMGLSADHPTNFFQFNVKKGLKGINSCPVIKCAKVKKIFPDTVYVDYLLREPVALLYDYQNAAIDGEGYLFPITPYFAPKRLPEIYLGVAMEGKEKIDWNEPLAASEISLALALLQQLSKPEYSEFKVLRIDTSQAYADSYGRREIVLITEDQVRNDLEGGVLTYLLPRIVRLSSPGYKDALENYLKLRPLLTKRALEQLLNDAGQSIVKAPAVIVDMRIPGLSFLQAKRQE